MSSTPRMYDHLRHVSVRNRALAWFADHSYRRAATRGAAFVLAINVVQYMVRKLDELMPGAAEPAMSMRWFLLDGAVMVLLGALLMCVATAGARGIARMYVRTQTRRG
jgi:hypothetical protein